MKFLYYFLFCSLSFPFFSRAQVTNWQWAKNSTCSGDDRGNDIAIDNNGNVYVVGNFVGTFTLASTTLNSAGAKDIYLAKYDALGSLQWLKQIGGSGNDDAVSIVIDNNNMVYIAGSISGTLSVGTNVLTSNGGTDILIAKYDENGNVQWAKSYGTSNTDRASSITKTHSGKILLAGIFGGPGTIAFDSFTLSNAGSGNNDDIFLLDLEDNGTINWARRFGNGTYESCTDIEVDAADNIYMLGQFDQSTSIGSISVSSISSGFVGGNILVAKLDQNGGALWADPIGGINIGSTVGASLEVGDIEVTASGSVYLVGVYSGCKLRFHNGVMLPESSNGNFLVKYDETGSYIWSKVAPQGYASVNGMCLDIFEDVYLTGFFQSMAIFGNDTLHAVGRDVFIAKYHADGSCPWAMNFDGSGAETGNAIVNDQNGDIYVAGEFFNAPFDFGGDTLFNSGGLDMFVLKIAEPLSVIKQELVTTPVKIYPNPAKGYINVAVEVGAYLSVSISDAIGRTVYKRQISSYESQLQIDLSGLSDGVYFIELDGKERIVNGKVVVRN